jgi:hypothetical protein
MYYPFNSQGIQLSGNSVIKITIFWMMDELIGSSALLRKIIITHTHDDRNFWQMTHQFFFKIIFFLLADKRKSSKEFLNDGLHQRDLFILLDNINYFVRFQVPTSVSMKVTAFRDTVLCSFTKVERCFRGAYCLHHQGDDAGSMHLWNVSLLQQDHTALYPRKLSSSLHTFTCIFVFLKFKFLFWI